MSKRLRGTRHRTSQAACNSSVILVSRIKNERYVQSITHLIEKHPISSEAVLCDGQ